VTVTDWPRYPTIYEINTWVWLSELGKRAGTAVDLATVPATEWDALAAYGFDAVWLMGVWERSPAGTVIANQNQELLADFRRVLPDFRLEDNVGSPYCVRAYRVDPHLGGDAGLAAARRELAKRGLRLLLDLVPNHVAPDHAWAREHPEYFVQGRADDARRDPASFAQVGGVSIARGRDPNFPPWPDVLQLNAFQPALRRAMIEMIAGIAGQCDGIRCDMAMLLLNDVFQRTWGDRAGPRPQSEYWTDVIGAVRAGHPEFRFIAEAYWDLEWTLQQLGFDYCYDKRLLDRLEHDDAESVRLHLCAEPAYQRRLVRFIENHDEPRAAAAFPPDREQAAAVTMATLMGARMFHEGQFEGRRVRVPVFLGRRPDEPVNTAVQTFYRKLLSAINHPTFRLGDWRLCESTGWVGDPTHRNVLAWSWHEEGDRYLVVVNLSAGAAQARVHVPWADMAGAAWRLDDALSGERYDRSGDEIASQGLYVARPPWGCHLFRLQRE
jgi:hypothetical protein